MKTFIKERNAALERGDVKEVIALMAKHGLPTPSSLAVAEAMMHKVRTAVPALPMPLRLESKRWLTARGLHSLDDGDLP